MKKFVKQERYTVLKDSATVLYMKELNKSMYNVLTSEEETELAIRYNNGDLKAYDTIIKANLRFVVSVSKQYVFKNISLMDIVNEGNIGLMKALERFDHTKGFKFISFAVWYIRQHILKFLNGKSRTVALPLNKIRVLKEISTIENSLEQKLNRNPSLNEIETEFRKTSHSQTYNVTNLNDYINLGEKSSSLDHNLSEDGNLTLLDLISSENNDDNYFDNDDLNSELTKHLKKLKYIDRYVLELSYGINKDRAYTINEISGMLDIGLSIERIRQIKKRGERLLSNKHNIKHLKHYL